MGPGGWGMTGETRSTNDGTWKAGEGLERPQDPERSRPKSSEKTTRGGLFDLVLEGTLAFIKKSRLEHADLEGNCYDSACADERLIWYSGGEGNEIARARDGVGWGVCREATAWDEWGDERRTREKSRTPQSWAARSSLETSTVDVVDACTSITSWKEVIITRALWETFFCNEEKFDLDLLDSAHRDSDKRPPKFGGLAGAVGRNT